MEVREGQGGVTLDSHEWRRGCSRWEDKTMTVGKRHSQRGDEGK